ncbi:hypothetical protein M2263_004164 [Providencia alcalifaciens]|nr:hypothetical protein [Providencia alcalifaciens]
MQGVVAAVGGSYGKFSFNQLNSGFGLENNITFELFLGIH